MLSTIIQPLLALGRFLQLQQFIGVVHWLGFGRGRLRSNPRDQQKLRPFEPWELFFHRSMFPPKISEFNNQPLQGLIALRGNVHANEDTNYPCQNANRDLARPFCVYSLPSFDDLKISSSFPIKNGQNKTHSTMVASAEPRQSSGSMRKSRARCLTMISNCFQSLFVGSS